MTTKLTLLATVLLAAVGSSAALAGRDKTPTQKGTMSCCATGQKVSPPAPATEMPAKTGADCHAPASAPKRCCK